MKNLEEMKINPERLLNDDKLIKLNGGENNPCGTGFTSVSCTYTLYGMANCGTVCVPTGSTGKKVVSDTYPDATNISCDDDAIA